MSRSLGVARERQVRKLLEHYDWWTSRAAGSHGESDVVALRLGYVPMLVQIKADSLERGLHFGPKDRRELRLAAAKAGARAVLCHWAPYDKPRWKLVGEDDKLVPLVFTPQGSLILATRRATEEPCDA